MCAADDAWNRENDQFHYFATQQQSVFMTLYNLIYEIFCLKNTHRETQEYQKR